MNATVCLRRCLFLQGAWLSHRAYDARMVNMAVGIVLESVNHVMQDLKTLILLLSALYAQIRPLRSLRWGRENVEFQHRYLVIRCS